MAWLIEESAKGHAEAGPGIAGCVVSMAGKTNPGAWLHSDTTSFTKQRADANQTYCGDHFAYVQILNHYVIHLKPI